MGHLECVMLDPMGLLLLPADEHPAEHEDTISCIPQKLMRRMMLSGIWQRYERGHIPSLEDAAKALAEVPFVRRSMRPGPGPGPRMQNCALAKMIAHCISHTRSHFRELPDMGKLLDNLRDQLNVRLVCTANATHEEICVLRSRFPTLFARFDTIVISGKEGVGKTSQQFMQVALQKAGVHHARRSMYLDASDIQSVVAARSIGMHAALVQPHHLINCISTSAANINLEDMAILLLPLTAQPAPQPPQTTPNYRLQHIRSYSKAIPNSKPLSCPFTDLGFIPPDLTSKKMSDNGNRYSYHIVSARRFLFQIGQQESQPTRAYQFPSLASDGVRVWDNFTQFMMADVLNDPRFLPMQSPPANGLLCFVDKTNYTVQGKIDTLTGLPAYHEPDGSCMQASRILPIMDGGASTLKDIPDDLDITSIGLSVLHKFGKVSMETINKVLDNMLEYVSRDDGVLQVYFDPERPRIDPVVVANVIYLFHLADRGQEVEASERFVQSVLLHRAYVEDGTLYYKLGEAFLMHVARLVQRFKEHFTTSGMRGLLAERLKEHRASERWRRRAAGDDALALAMGMRAYWLCGLEEDDLKMREIERQGLVRLQRAEGCWNSHGYYRYGANLQSWMGNEGLTTAYSLVGLTTL